MTLPQLLRLLCLALFLAGGNAALSAALRVATFNCYFLVDPARAPEGQLASKAPKPEVYASKLENLGGLIRNLDVVALQEVGSETEAKALAKVVGYEAKFVQGRDTFTGQDVATLIAPKPGRVVRSAQRVKALETLSKHLLVVVDDAGIRYQILNVHLLRPIGKNVDKQAGQLQAIQAWIESERQRSAESVIVVLGDFNNPAPKLLDLTDSAALTDFAATHLGGKAIDRIFTNGRLVNVEVVRPPLPRRPNDLLKMLWTDHFLVSATVDR